MAGFKRNRRWFTEDELAFRVKVLLSHHYTEEEIANELRISIQKVRELIGYARAEAYLVMA